MPSRKRIALITKEPNSSLESFLGALPGKPEILISDSISTLPGFQKAPVADLFFLDADSLENEELAFLRMILQQQTPQPQMIVSFSLKGKELAREIRALGAVPIWKPYLLEELFQTTVTLLEDRSIAVTESSKLAPSYLIRGLSDELNNPLATISGYLQLLELDFEKTQSLEIREKLAVVRDGIQRISTTLEALQLSGEGRKPQKTTIELNHFVREQLKKNKTKPPKPSLRFDSEHKNLPVSGDAKLLAIAFQELLDAVYELAEPDREIKIKLFKDSENAKSEITLEFVSTKLDPEDAKQLFEPYGLNAKGLSIGLRLAAARGVFRSHGGEISGSMLSKHWVQFKASLPSR